MARTKFLLHDIMPEDFWKWRFIEKKFHHIADLFNFKEIRTSLLQDTQSMEKSYLHGVIQKEGLTYDDLFIRLAGEDNLSLRPESTITVLKSDIGERAKREVQKVYYYGPIFRRRTDSQRYQLYQFGFEILGNNTEIADIEIMRIGVRIFRQLGLRNVKLKLNSYGCDVCRPTYNDAIAAFITDPASQTCDRCSESTLFHPLQSFKCAHKKCRQLLPPAPQMIDFLCPDCQNKMRYIQRILSNISTDHEIDPYLNRIFGYYNGNVFNFVCEVNGEEVVIGGGGRYDELSTMLFDERVPAVGVAFDMEQILQIMDSFELFHQPEPPFKILVWSENRSLELQFLQIILELHDHDYRTIMEQSDHNRKAVIERARRENVALAILVTDDSVRNGSVQVVNILKEHQESIQLSDILSYVDRFEKSVRFRQ